MLAFFLAQAATLQPLNLTCFGGGTANKPSVATVNSYGSFSGNVGSTPVYGNGNGASTIVGQRHQTFDDQVDVRLFAGDDRIRLPRTMLPPAHGGTNGWFKLKDVVADARAIRAKAAVNRPISTSIVAASMSRTVPISFGHS
jgi:hypothetical protein